MLALLIFIATYQETCEYFSSLVATFFFTFSVYTLSNLDSQDGVIMAALFAVTSYIFIQKKKPLLTGVFLSFCFLTKAYYVPVLIALSYLSIKTFNKRQLFKWIGGLTLGMLPIIPFVINSYKEMYDSLFGFSLTKPQEVNKLAEIRTFIIYNAILVNYKFYTCNLFTYLACKKR